ncbi:tRNA (adenosine(37)-N6)-dimethylallyltransferase MiaA [Candidatus Neptunochlamydia vexilliferae]|uniref:tRNA dimethylallyltransferase n=1 Tax=Candidatus Neptunichlamydia vexilliferae TaxID=1651774 RepID=A0ABS0AYH9_9BACT|nr:tRNA (adenosine(37)-N6)-dimethylallyltransferase MiaA [Candidatus Neptunochlamydia vexilliferae]MBF5059187.1 tRNA dimethylallyltransferase [Candidatus Neptunochlamydia vexilliferae]
MRGDLLDAQGQEPAPSRKKIDALAGTKRVIVLSGPTAAGKTRLSLELARILGGEIVSADSVQVYRGMDIGTAKATPEERMEVPHHLIDTHDLSESFNVVQFYEQATGACREILSRGHVPIVVGGTGFYLHALLYGPPQGPPASQEVRQKLEEDIEKFGTEAIYDKLCSLDPDYGATINHRDRHKIIRALEIITLTGKKVSEFPKGHVPSRPKEFDFRCWFIYFPKEILFSRIEMRCDEMMTQGFIEEVEALENEGLRENLSAAQAIGYRQCLEFLDSPRSDEDWEHFVWEFKKASRRYAKRQFTWFRREPLFRWVDLDVYGYQKALEMILQDYESRY